MAIDDYHVYDNIDSPIDIPFEKGTIENKRIIITNGYQRGSEQI